MNKIKLTSISLIIILTIVSNGYGKKVRISGNYIIKIKQLINNNKKVSLIIYIPEKSINILANPPVADKHNMPKFKKAISQKIYSGTVRIIAGYFENIENFNIVNRDNLNKIIKEQELSQTGLLENSTRVKIGGLIGANYILSISHTMTLSNTVSGYMTFTKLIEISTGKVLSSDEAQIIGKKVDGKEIYTYTFNGEEVDVIGGKMYKKMK